MVMDGMLAWGDYVAYPLDDAVDISSSSMPASSYHIRQGLSDAAFILGPKSGFYATGYGVYLYSITVAAGQVSYDFRCDCMPAVRWLLEFPAGTEFGCTAYADCTPIAGGAADPGYGTAWATAGELTELLALPDGVYVPLEQNFVEAARIQDASNAYVYAVNVGNIARPCPGNCCSSSSFDPNDDDVEVVATDLVGDIVFKEGFNCSIRVRTADNSVEFGADPNGGAGPVCEDLIVDGSGIHSSDTGCPDAASCDSYIKSINGLVTSGALTVVGGPGVVVTPTQALHRVTIQSEENRLCASSSSFSV